MANKPSIWVEIPENFDSKQDGQSLARMMLTVLILPVKLEIGYTKGGEHQITYVAEGPLDQEDTLDRENLDEMWDFITLAADRYEED